MLRFGSSGHLARALRSAAPGEASDDQLFVQPAGQHNAIYRTAGEAYTREVAVVTEDEPHGLARSSLLPVPALAISSPSRTRSSASRPGQPRTVCHHSRGTHDAPQRAPTSVPPMAATVSVSLPICTAVSKCGADLNLASLGRVLANGGPSGLKGGDGEAIADEVRGGQAVGIVDCSLPARAALL